MIEVGKKYCPVCIANNGTGDDPLIAPLKQAKGVVPCRYPWQTPIGVLGANTRAIGNQTPVDVMFRGTFELYWNNDDDSGTEPDIYGCGVMIALRGVRVYYDAKHSIYVTEHAIKADITTGAIVDDWIGTYPGSATVGYISAVRIDEAHDDAGWVTVTIDPRPAKSKYRIANCSQRLPEALGLPVGISSPDNVAVGYSATISPTCDGVIAGFLDRHSNGINTMVYQAVVCTAGPAWIFPDYSLFDICDEYDIQSYNIAPDNVPINANLNFAPFKIGSVTTAPIVGYAHMKKWYDYAHGMEGYKYRMIINVCPDTPTRHE